MANYTLANLVKAQIKLQGEFAQNDTRYRVPAVFQMFLNGAERFFPNYKSLKTAVNRTVETNYFARTAQSLLTTAPSHDHTGTGGDSGILALAWQPYKATFSMTLKQANNSTWTWQEEYTNEIRQKVIDFADGLDDAAGSYLFNNRSGATSGTVDGKVSFNGTNDAYEVAIASESEVATLIKLTADINKYQGQTLDVACDPILYSKVLVLSNQGAGNSTNTSFQFLNTNWILDPKMSARAVGLDAGYNKGFGVVAPRGHIACADWISQQNRTGVETSVNMYGSLLNPVDGLQYGVHTYETRADGTSVNGQTQDVVTQTEMSIFLSFNHAPSTVTDETPLMAFAIV